MTFSILIWREWRKAPTMLELYLTLHDLLLQIKAILDEISYMWLQGYISGVPVSSGLV